MPNELNEQLKTTYQEAANNLTGSARRKFMAGIVESLGRGGLSYCASELGWDPKTMRKGRQELAGGEAFADRPTSPGRKRAEEQLPTLLDDLKALLDEQSQTDATFQSERLYTRLSVQEVRSQLIAQQGTQKSSCPATKCSGSASTIWATSSERSRRISQKKDPRDRCHLRPLKACP